MTEEINEAIAKISYFCCWKDKAYMDILIDNPEANRKFQELLSQIPRMKNGNTVKLMKDSGINYKVSWGVSIVDLRNMAQNYEKDHLLALKLWNKQWRETMILATILEDPKTLGEEQMDYWAKSLETVEMVEQAVANLFVYSQFAFAKTLEYCCGKKSWLHYSGLQLMGRLALVDKNAIDEMFDTFFEVLPPLAKDPALATVFYRSLILMAERNTNIEAKCVEFLKDFPDDESQSGKTAKAILEYLR